MIHDLAGSTQAGGIELRVLHQVLTLNSFSLHSSLNGEQNSFLFQQTRCQFLFEFDN
jgi:hypothetical protein